MNTEIALCADCVDFDANGWDEAHKGRPLPDPAPMGLLRDRFVGPDPAEPSCEGHFSKYPCDGCGITDHGTRYCYVMVECLDGPEGCSGPVEYRMALSGTGRSYPRCEKHWDERLARQDEINERYFSTPSSHYCRHGNYIGDPYGADYICGACENGDD